MKTRIIIALVIGLCSAYCIMAADSLTLRYRLHPGEPIRYREVISASVQAVDGKSQPTENRLTIKITSQEYPAVKATNSLHVTRVLESGSLTHFQSSSQKTKAYELPKISTSLTISPQGKLLHAKSNTAAKSDNRRTFQAKRLEYSLGVLEAVIHHLPLSETAVKTGNTWQNEVVFPLFTEKRLAHARFDSRLIAVATYHGIPCAQIRTSFQIPVIINTEDVAALLSESQKAQYSSIKGTLIGRIEWQFDYTNGRMLYAAGPISLEAAPVTEKPNTIPSEAFRFIIKCTVQTGLVKKGIE